MKIIIFGTGQFAEIAKLYFEAETDSEVVAFTIEERYIKETEFCGLPVVPFERIQQFYSPLECEMFVAIIYGDMNRTRERIAAQAKEKGYLQPTYVSLFATRCSEVSIGEGTFIFEDNTLQPFCKIGNNVILWSGNHIAHSATVMDNVFISSHVVISGNCRIGRNCFIGVNATIGDGVTIGEYSWISPGAIITKDVPPHSLVKSVKSEVVPLNEEALFRRLKK